MKKIATLSIFAALSLTVWYLESLIPLPIPLPGVKPGLANIFTLLGIVYFGKRDTALILAVRLTLSALILGNFLSLLYSAGGAVLAFVIACVLRRFYPEKVSLIGISVACATMHNIGQVTVACIIMGSFAYYSYLPLLILCGMVTGTAVGVVSGIVFKRVNIEKLL